MPAGACDGGIEWRCHGMSSLRWGESDWGGVSGIAPTRVTRVEADGGQHVDFFSSVFCYSRSIYLTLLSSPVLVFDAQGEGVGVLWILQMARQEECMGRAATIRQQWFSISIYPQAMPFSLTFSRSQTPVIIGDDG